MRTNTALHCKHFIPYALARARCEEARRPPSTAAARRWPGIGPSPSEGLREVSCQRYGIVSQGMSVQRTAPRPRLKCWPSLLSVPQARRSRPTQPRRPRKTERGRSAGAPIVYRLHRPLRPGSTTTSPVAPTMASPCSEIEPRTTCRRGELRSVAENRSLRCRYSRCQHHQEPVRRYPHDFALCHPETASQNPRLHATNG